MLGTTRTNQDCGGERKAREKVDREIEVDASPQEDEVSPARHSAEMKVGDRKRSTQSLAVPHHQAVSCESTGGSVRHLPN